MMFMYTIIIAILVAATTTMVTASGGGGGLRRNTKYVYPACPKKPFFSSCVGRPNPCNDEFIGVTCCVCSPLEDDRQYCSYEPCRTLQPTPSQAPTVTVAPTRAPSTSPPQCPRDLGTFPSCDDKPSPCLNLGGENGSWCCNCSSIPGGQLCAYDNC
jgi:hypothetical protein